jgi:MFS family permease
MLKVLLNRYFMLYLSGGLISLTGGFMLSVAILFQVFKITGSALAVGIIFIVNTLPDLFLSSPAGVYIDRWGWKRTIIAGNLIRGVAILLLVFCRSSSELWIFYMVIFIEAAVSQFLKISDNVLISRLARKNRLLQANSLSSINCDLAMLIGPAICGILIELKGIDIVWVLISSAFMIEAFIVSLIPGTIGPSSRCSARKSSPAALPKKSNFRKEFLITLTIIRKHRLIAAVFITLIFAMPGAGIFSVMLVPYLHSIGGDIKIYGFFLSFLAGGRLIGGFLTGYIGKYFTHSQLFKICLIISSVCLFLVINTPLTYAALIAFFMGIPSATFQISLQSILQSGAKPKYRGRIFGAFETAVAFLMLFGLGVAGAAGNYLSALFMMNLAAGLQLLSGLIGFILFREAPLIEDRIEAILRGLFHWNKVKTRKKTAPKIIHVH